MERLRVSLFLLLLFCSPCLSEGKTFFTHLGTLCAEDCKSDGDEYKCRSTDEDGKSQSMYCSPQQNVDYWGRQCRADSMCAKYGEDYSWCRINIFSWGFCGLVKEDQTLGDAGEDQHNTSPHRNRRDRKVVEVINDSNIGRTITISEETARSGTFANSNKKLRREAEDLINQWNNVHLVNQARSKLITSDHLRIDMQGMVPQGNKRYHNLQVQINGVQRGKKLTSTTLSQVFVHNDGVPEQYIKRGFLFTLMFPILKAIHN